MADQMNSWMQPPVHADVDVAGLAVHDRRGHVEELPLPLDLDLLSDGLVLVPRQMHDLLGDAGARTSAR